MLSAHVIHHSLDRHMACHQQRIIIIIIIIIITSRFQVRLYTFCFRYQHTYRRCFHYTRVQHSPIAYTILIFGTIAVRRRLSLRPFQQAVKNLRPLSYTVPNSRCR